MLRVLVKLASLIAEPSEVQWKLDLADTDLAENLGLKDTLQKIWAKEWNFLTLCALSLGPNSILYIMGSLPGLEP